MGRSLPYGGHKLKHGIRLAVTVRPRGRKSALPSTDRLFSSRLVQ